MPEYRRFIAYFYEYIDGKKQKNAGFAKVELRSGMWRILFRVTADVMPSGSVKVYGFVREGGYLLGFLLGTMPDGREIAEEWAYQSDVLIGYQKYRFADLSGIWIQSEDDRYFITVWDDEAMNPEKFVLEIPQAAAVEEEKYQETQTAVPDRKKHQEMWAEGKLQKGQISAAEEKYQEMRMAVPEEKKLQKEQESAPEEKMPQEEQKFVSEKQKRQKEQESASEEKNLREEQEPVSEESELQKRQTSALKAEKEQDDRIIRGMENGSCVSRAQERPLRHCEYRTGCIYETQPLIEEIFQKRKAFAPFGEDAGMECVQLLPCDVMRLQQNSWNVGRSSFLQHGFYQYRHLLLGRQKNGAYVIGVPGMKNPQEQYMAELFGYEQFKLAHLCGCGKSFGYWYRPLERRQ